MEDFQLPHRWAVALEIIQWDFPDAVIAGGALRDLILGREVKDIDVFAQIPRQTTSHTIKAWAEKYLGGQARIVINEEFAKACPHIVDVVCAIECVNPQTMPIPIQLILTPFPVTMHVACERIDFGLCRVAHNGKELLCTDDFAHDREFEVFTLRRDGDSPAQIRRSYERHTRLQGKYPGWPIMANGTDLRKGEAFKIDHLYMENMFGVGGLGRSSLSY